MLHAVYFKGGPWDFVESCLQIFSLIWLVLSLTFSLKFSGMKSGTIKNQCIFVTLLVTFAHNWGRVSKGPIVQLVMSLNFLGISTSLKFCLLWLVSYKVYCVYTTLVCEPWLSSQKKPLRSIGRSGESCQAFMFQRAALRAVWRHITHVVIIAEPRLMHLGIKIFES